MEIGGGGVVEEASSAGAIEGATMATNWRVWRSGGYISLAERVTQRVPRGGFGEDSAPPCGVMRVLDQSTAPKGRIQACTERAEGVGPRTRTPHGETNRQLFPSNFWQIEDLVR